jgi:serine/threonine protein kinase
MSYCINPDCQKPQNPNATKFCQKCGTKLLLAERYRAIQLIGAGGMGRTLLAEDEYKPSKPHCVIKQFYPQGQNNAGKAAELFQQEAVRLEQLGKHPQIPELFAHFEQDNRQYIVQEFIDGQNLAEELAETGVFREKQIRSLLNDLLPVLQFIHNGQVIHRDIKPDNIIRRRSDGKLVLVDFGAAKYATGTALGKTGTTIGSAGYAAPEQTFGQAVFASDIYGLGVTCIHLLTNIEPFELYNAMESAFVWRHHLGDNPVSDQLERVLDKMTQSVVKQRYKSAEGVMQALGLNVGTQTSKNKPRPQINRKVIQPPTPSEGRQSGTPAPVLKSSSPAKVSPATTVQPVTSQIVSANVSLITTISESQGKVFSIAISPDGQTLASGTEDSIIQFWDLHKGWEIGVLGGTLFFLPSYSVISVAFSPDGQTLASSPYRSNDKIKLWDVSVGREKRTLRGNFLGCVFAVAFSPDGQTIASGCDYGGIKLWNVSTGQEKLTIDVHSHSGSVNSVAFSPDGQSLATGAQYGTTQLWNVNTGKEKHTLKGHAGNVFTVAFSPDGQTIASGSQDKTIKLWDVRTGQEKRTLEGHSNWIYSVAFSPDGQTIASGSYDNAIKLWDVLTGQELRTLDGHSEAVRTLAFTPNGQFLVSGSEDKTIKIWRVTR